MIYKVVFSPEAQQDLEDIYLFIAKASRPGTALRFVADIEACCLGFRSFPERGVLRNDLMPGLRVMGFRRRVSIAFHVDPDRVTIDRIMYGGRNLDRLKP